LGVIEDDRALIDKSILGIAGEFAVATELCRLSIYAQLTLGNQKRVDLLTVSREGKFLRIEVKAKQTPTWSSIKGVSAADAFLVFVDFAGKKQIERPDFFVLSAADWRVLATDHIEQYRVRHPDRNPYLDEENCPVFPEELNQRGKPFRGCTVKVAAIESHREKWHKIVDACALVSDAAVKKSEDE
jgi:hypothetical protein